MIKHPPDAHTPLRQLADFLQRGRCDGMHTRILVKGGDLMIVYNLIYEILYRKT